MKIIIIHLNAIDPAEFLSDTPGTGMELLLNNGAHGLLDAHDVESPFPLLKSILQWTTWIDSSGSLDSPELLQSLNQDACLIGLSVKLPHVGESLETLLESLTGESILVALSAIDTAGKRAFVLTTSNGLPPIRVDNISMIDLVATVLDLAGVDRTQGDLGEAQSLVSVLGAPSTERDDEELVRERLRGLGYIA